MASIPIYADFYFYKNTPVDKNEVNFFNTGEDNNTMASEFLGRIQQYKVGSTWNSQVPFNPSATEIYVNSFPGADVSIEEILSINYIVVVAWDRHNGVSQLYKRFAYFVESVEPYAQTMVDDGKEDTGARSAFGFSYRFKIKKDTFASDFLFLNKSLKLQDLFVDGLRINVVTPTTEIKNNIKNYMPSLEYYSPFSLPNVYNANISTIVQRKKAETNIEGAGTSTIYTYTSKGGLNSVFVAIAIFSASVSETVDYATSFVCSKCASGNISSIGVSLEQAISDALDFMRVSRIKPKANPGNNEYIDLKYLYILPASFVQTRFDPTTETEYSIYSKAGSAETEISDKIYKWSQSWNKDKISTFALPEYITKKYYGWEADNITLVAGRQRIELPQIIFDGNFLNDISSTCDIYFSNNDFGISVCLNVAGKVIDVTEEYSLPVLSTASADAVQREIAKTSSILKGALSIVGGAIATVGGFATGNAAAGVAGLGAIVGGATSIAQGATTEDRGGNVSVTGGNADAITALKNGFLYYDVEPCANSIEILNTSQRYGYNFNGMFIKTEAESIFNVDALKYNFMYIEAQAERIFDYSDYFPETFKTWLIERMKNGVRFFYTFDEFFNKIRGQTGYIKA